MDSLECNSQTAQININYGVILRWYLLIMKSVLNVRQEHEVLLQPCTQQRMIWEFHSDIQLVGLGSYTIFLGRKLRMCEMVIIRYTIILHDMRHMYRLYCYSNSWICTSIHSAKSRMVLSNVRPNGIVRPYAKKHLLYGTPSKEHSVLRKHLKTFVFRWT